MSRGWSRLRPGLRCAIVALVVPLLAACSTSPSAVEFGLAITEGQPEAAAGVHRFTVAGNDSLSLFTEDGSPLSVTIPLHVSVAGHYVPELRGVPVLAFRTTYELQHEGRSLGEIIHERETRLAQEEPLHVME